MVPMATSFVLRVVDVDGRDQRLKKFVVPKQVPNIAEAAGKLAGEIFELSQDVARTQIGMARFRVHARHGNVARAQFPFVVRGQAQLPLGEGANVVESEPATPAGMVGQAMRHNEALMRLMMETVGAMTEGLRQENLALRERAAKAEEVWMEGRLKLEELLDRSQARKIQEAKELGGEQRKDLMLRKLADEVIPQVAKQLPGVLEHVGLLPEGSKTAETDADKLKAELRGILAKLPADKAELLVGSLSPEDQERLSSLLV